MYLHVHIRWLKRASFRQRSGFMQIIYTKKHIFTTHAFTHTHKVIEKGKFQAVIWNFPCVTGGEDGKDSQVWIQSFFFFLFSLFSFSGVHHRHAHTHATHLHAYLFLCIYFIVFVFSSALGDRGQPRYSCPRAHLISVSFFFFSAFGDRGQQGADGGILCLCLLCPAPLCRGALRMCSLL